MDIWHELIDLIFPDSNHCLICGQKSNIKPLCNNCFNSLNLLSKQEFCRKCGKFIETNNNKQILLCQDCLEQKYPFIFARAYGPYQGILKELIYEYKYTGRRSLVKFLTNLMIKTMQVDQRFSDIDLIMPVPNSLPKLMARRFNQSELLAKKIADILKIELDHKNLIKVKDTISQSKLTRQMRQVNLKGAFLLREKQLVRGRKILLVDDIITTGSTLRECCQVLLAAEVDSVKVITLAAGKDIPERGI